MTNPILNSFLPLFYIAWSDDVLTEKEATLLQESINSQDWLTKADKKELLSKINIDNPPTVKRNRLRILP